MCVGTRPSDIPSLLDTPSIWLLRGITTQRYRPGQFTLRVGRETKPDQPEVTSGAVALSVQTSQERACPRIHRDRPIGSGMVLAAQAQVLRGRHHKFVRRLGPDAWAVGGRS